MGEGTGIKRILLIEDDRDYRNLLKTYIGKYLPDVEIQEYDPVSKGAPADEFDWSQYDVLILDYYLCIYGLTGLDLLQKHRKKAGFPAAIMLTGAGNEEVAVRALNFGVYEYLRKENLTKEQFIESIGNSFRKHQEEIIRHREQEKASQAFDKSLFYKLLESTAEAISRNSRLVLLLVEVDDMEGLSSEYGLIMRDNLLRYLGSQCYETLKETDNPYITRLGDATVGILIGYISREILESKIQKLWDRFDTNPYIFADKSISYTTSTGALIIDRADNNSAYFLEQASRLKDAAREDNGNSCRVASLIEIVDAENKRRHEEEQKLREEEAERERILMEEKARLRKIEEERLRQEEEKQKAEKEAERLKAEEEARQLQAERERLREIELERQKEDEKRIAEAAERERARVQEENERRQEEEIRQQQEVARKKAEEERKVIEEQQRKETAARQQAEEEKQRIAEQERLYQEAEKHRLEVQEKQRLEEEARKREAAASDEIRIDESTLDENSLILKKAFNENRVIQTFQPVIAMFTPETGNAPALFKVDIEMIDEHGNIIASVDIDRQHTALNLQQFTDRWILREIIGRIANREEFRTDKIYLITISEAWLADVTLFNWLKKLLTGLENIKPGKFIALEFPVSMLAAHKKRALALMKALKQTHGFEIAIGEVTTATDLKNLSGLKDFDLLTVKWDLIDGLRKTQTGADNMIISTLKSQGTHIIFDGIEDSTMLTDAINIGTDYVMGSFIGEPQRSQAGAGNVESFDISY